MRNDEISRYNLCMSRTATELFEEAPNCLPAIWTGSSKTFSAREMEGRKNERFAPGKRKWANRSQVTMSGSVPEWKRRSRILPGTFLMKRHEGLS